MASGNPQGELFQAETTWFHSGEALEGGVVHIEHLTLNVFRDNAQQVNIAAEAIDEAKRILGGKHKNSSP